MNILVIAPHRDDEIIGCGGTIAKYIDNGDKVFICFVTTPTEPMFAKDLIQKISSEARECHKLLNITKTFELNFPAVTLETVDKYKINSAIVDVINEVTPDIVYIPHYGDMHIDHKVVADCSMVALRPNGKWKVKEIYSYETLSETEWNYTDANYAFIPNVWSDISNYMSLKIDSMSCYQSQLFNSPHPRSLESIQALAKFRGSSVLLDMAECFRLIRKID